SDGGDGGVHRHAPEQRLARRVVAAPCQRVEVGTRDLMDGVLLRSCAERDEERDEGETEHAERLEGLRHGARRIRGAWGAGCRLPLPRRGPNSPRPGRMEATGDTEDGGGCSSGWWLRSARRRGQRGHKSSPWAPGPTTGPSHGGLESSPSAWTRSGAWPRDSSSGSGRGSFSPLPATSPPVSRSTSRRG